MFPSVFLKTFMAACVALFVAGCATSFSSGGAVYDADKPQTFLPGANISQAKGIAMGSAVSKGWTVSQTMEDAVVLQRTLNAAAAESVAPGAALAPLPPTVEVRSTFFQRGNGVDVMLDAQVVTGRGTDQEKKIDFTESYRGELTRSLNALSQAWSASGWRVASAVPPLPATETATVPPGSSDELLAEDSSLTQVVAEGEAGPADIAQDPVADAPAPMASTQAPVSTVESAWGSTPAPVVTGSAPVEERLTSPPAEPAGTVEAMDAAPPPGSDMLVLGSSGDTGIWAYYAEHYARIRGCTLTDAGSVLVEKQNYSETHRVDCQGGRSFLVRCNAGVCRGLR